MIPVQHLLGGGLAAVIRKAPLTPEKVAFAWRTAVGQALARATTVELRGDVLHVRTRDVAWARELERSAGVVRSRLDALLGDSVVRWVEVAVDGAG